MRALLHPHATLLQSQVLTGSFLSAGDWVADDVHLAFGGVAPKTITAPKTEALLRGQPWTEANVTAALKTLAEDVWISPDAPGARRHRA